MADLPKGAVEETDGDERGSAETAGRRGRKATPPDPADGPVAAFARELWDLKRQAGDPSYAAMRTRLGAAVSRSSLSAATRGSALPSWETTWEFVRVLAVDTLGADPQETKARWWAKWKAAGAGDAARPETPEGAPAPPEAGTPPRTVVRPSFAQVTAAVAAIVVMVAGVGLLVGWFFAPSAEPALEPAVDDTQLDDAAFEGDITIPDGTVVAPGQVFTKVWQIRNTGRVRWEGRYLTRMNTTQCSAPDMVPIPTTDPGESVQITVRVTASPAPSHCKIYWKATDASRRLLFPDKNPIFLDVTVSEEDAPGTEAATG